LGGNEQKYVLDCLQTTWISSTGQYIEKFEQAFAQFCGVKHAITCCNGTVSLHLALLALGVEPEDEVIVPTLTFVASANAVVYCRARPVFVDVDPQTWTIDPGQIETVITPRTRGIIAVHLAGHPAEMDAIQRIADRHNLWVLEDAAQAHGAQVNGRRVGSIGQIGSFSFFGNKIISTGEGGMVTTNDDAMARKIRLLKNHGMDPQRRYWHPVVGYNYRMTNVQAAIGLAQIERIDWQLQRRQEVVSWYRQELDGVEGITWQQEKPWARHVWWMFTAVLGEQLDTSPEVLMSQLQQRGIETRRVVYPMHQLPPYQHTAAGRAFPVADRLSARGLNLPTFATLTRDDVHWICRSLLECIGKAARARMAVKA
ncbi:MAG TPA: DegT/DnrJ/EryC1/StrS family aminotransferase, partial [Tepidisphaeraceae bacterium]|nr:DegT/DnrJ/EryC1/StrS family aminotransferase [Tepidisphaeraceae bacterium]